MNRCMENIELLKCVDKPNFFVTHADIPYKYTDYTLKHYVTQMQNRVLNTMHEKLGVDISDAALRDAVARHNEICRSCPTCRRPWRRSRPARSTTSPGTAAVWASSAPRWTTPT